MTAHVMIFTNTVVAKTLTAAYNCKFTGHLKWSKSGQAMKTGTFLCRFTVGFNIPLDAQ